MKNTRFQQKENYLLAVASGVRNHFSEVVEGTFQLSEAARKMNATHILGDYRDVRFNVPLVDAFNLVKVYEHRFKHFHKIVMATVVNSEDLELAKFWESICNKRGFKTAVFLTIEDADKWLLEQTVNSGS